AWIADPDAKPHGGESVAEVSERVAAWLDERLGERGHLVAVTHPVGVRAAIIHAIGAMPSSCARTDRVPLARPVLPHDGRSWRLRSHGCCPSSASALTPANPQPMQGGAAEGCRPIAIEGAAVYTAAGSPARQWLRSPTPTRERGTHEQRRPEPF